MKNERILGSNLAWKRSKSWVALFTVIAFTFTSIVWNPNGFASTGAASASEISAFTPAILSIPAELGQVTELVKGNPSAPAFIHIQSAHGNDQAERNIEKILRYLSTNSSVKLMLLEGAAGNLQPELFRMFPERPDFNRKVTDKLVQDGYLTGPENFLINQDDGWRMEDGDKRKVGSLRPPPSAIQGYGVEDLEAYKEDRAAFISVVKSDKTGEAYLLKLRASLDKRFAAKLNKDLLNLVRKEEALASGSLSFDFWIKALGEASKKHLKMDLSDAFYQGEYPFLIRYDRLHAMGAEIDQDKAMKEFDGFIKELETRNVSKEIIQSFWATSQGLRARESEGQNLGRGSWAVSRDEGYSVMRRAFDNAFEKLPKDFSMKAWPHWTLYAQYVILMQEMEGKGLHDETLRLKDKIQTSLARTPEEKEYLTQARELYLLRRLFALELTRNEYEELKNRDTAHASRTTKSEGQLVARGPWPMAPSAKTLFSSAMSFYSFAIDRENKMFVNALRRMGEVKEQRAVIVTGGFHSEGLRNLAASKGCSYVQISPRINEVSKRDHEVYLRAMLGSRDFETSQIPALLGTVPDAERVGVTGAAQTQTWRSELRSSVISQIHSEPVADQPELHRAFDNSLLNVGVSLRAVPATVRSDVRDGRTQYELALEEVYAKYIQDGLTLSKPQIEDRIARRANYRVIDVEGNVQGNRHGLSLIAYANAEQFQESRPEILERFLSDITATLGEEVVLPSKREKLHMTVGAYIHPDQRAGLPPSTPLTAEEISLNKAKFLDGAQRWKKGKVAVVFRGIILSRSGRITLRGYPVVEEQTVLGDDAVTHLRKALSLENAKGGFNISVATLFNGPKLDLEKLRGLLAKYKDTDFGTLWLDELTLARHENDLLEGAEEIASVRLDTSSVRSEVRTLDAATYDRVETPENEGDSTLLGSFMQYVRERIPGEWIDKLLPGSKTYDPEAVIELFPGHVQLTQEKVRERVRELKRSELYEENMLKPVLNPKDPAHIDKGETRLKIEKLFEVGVDGHSHYVVANLPGRSTFEQTIAFLKFAGVPREKILVHEKPSEKMDKLFESILGDLKDVENIVFGPVQGTGAMKKVFSSIDNEGEPLPRNTPSTLGGVSLPDAVVGVAYKHGDGKTKTLVLNTRAIFGQTAEEFMDWLKTKNPPKLARIFMFGTAGFIPPKKDLVVPGDPALAASNEFQGYEISPALFRRTLTEKPASPENPLRQELERQGIHGRALGTVSQDVLVRGLNALLARKEFNGDRTLLEALYPRETSKILLVIPNRLVVKDPVTGRIVKIVPLDNHSISWGEDLEKSEGEYDLIVPTEQQPEVIDETVLHIAAETMKFFVERRQAGVQPVEMELSYIDAGIRAMNEQRDAASKVQLFATFRITDTLKSSHSNERYIREQKVLEPRNDMIDAVVSKIIYKEIFKKPFGRSELRSADDVAAAILQNAGELIGDSKVSLAAQQLGRELAAQLKLEGFDLLRETLSTPMGQFAETVSHQRGVLESVFPFIKQMDSKSRYGGATTIWGHSSRMAEMSDTIGNNRDIFFGEFEGKAYQGEKLEDETWNAYRALQKKFFEDAENRLALRLSVLFHDIGILIQMASHEPVGAFLVKEILDRLPVSERVKLLVLWEVGNHLNIGVIGMGERTPKYARDRLNILPEELRPVAHAILVLLQAGEVRSLVELKNNGMLFNGRSAGLYVDTADPVKFADLDATYDTYRLKMFSSNGKWILNPAKYAEVQRLIAEEIPQEHRDQFAAYLREVNEWTDYGIYISQELQARGVVYMNYLLSQVAALYGNQIRNFRWSTPRGDAKPSAYGIEDFLTTEHVTLQDVTLVGKTPEQVEAILRKFRIEIPANKKFIRFDSNAFQLRGQLRILANDPTTGLDDGKIRAILEAVENGTLKRKGEDLDILKIVDGKEVVIGAIDRNIAHRASLLHRVPTTFIITPEGKLLFQRRAAHLPVEPNKIALFGGHMKTGHTYLDTVKSEIIEELNLPEDHKVEDARLKVIRSEGAFEWPTAWALQHNPSLDKTNRERRSHYVYFATEKEVAMIRETGQKLRDELSARGPAGFDAWLKKAQEDKNGYGEVSAIHEYSYEELMALNSEELASDLLRPLFHDPANQDVLEFLKTSLQSVHSARSEVREGSVGKSPSLAKENATGFDRAKIVAVPGESLFRFRNIRDYLSSHRELIPKVPNWDKYHPEKGEYFFSEKDLLAPETLYVFGDTGLLNAPFTITLSGTTSPSSDGFRVAQAVAQIAAKRGWVVIGGHAFGIDIATQTGALDEEKPSIAALPNGLTGPRDRPYPEMKYIDSGILAYGGAMVSEFLDPAATEIERQERLLPRDRIMSALADVVLVIESNDIKSGTADTARRGYLQGKRVYAIDWAKMKSGYKFAAASNVLSQELFQQGIAKPFLGESAVSFAELPEKVDQFLERIESELTLEDQLRTLAADESTGLKTSQIPGILEAVAKGALPLKGEDLDVVKFVEGKAVVIGAIDRNIIYRYGLTHRVPTTFVLTPKGKFLIPRRAHNVAQGLRLGLFEGYRKLAPHDPRTFEVERAEDLVLPEGWNIDESRNKVIRGERSFDWAPSKWGILNRQRRSVYVHAGDDDLIGMIRARGSFLKEKLAKLGETGYKQWLEDEQKIQIGSGDDWSIEEYTYEELMALGEDQLSSDVLWPLLHDPSHKDVQEFLKASAASVIGGRRPFRSVEDLRSQTFPRLPIDEVADQFLLYPKKLMHSPKLYEHLDAFDKEHYVFIPGEGWRQGFWRSKDFEGLRLGTWEDIEGTGNDVSLHPDIVVRYRQPQGKSVSFYYFSSHDESVPYAMEAAARGELLPQGNTQIFVDLHPDGSPESQLDGSFVSQAKPKSLAYPLAGNPSELRKWADLIGQFGSIRPFHMGNFNGAFLQTGFLSRHFWINGDWNLATGVKEGKKVDHLGEYPLLGKYFENPQRPKNTKAFINVDSDTSGVSHHFVKLEKEHYSYFEELLFRLSREDHILPATFHGSTSYYDDSNNDTIYEYGRVSLVRFLARIAPAIFFTSEKELPKEKLKGMIDQVMEQSLDEVRSEMRSESDLKGMSVARDYSFTPFGLAWFLSPMGQSELQVWMVVGLLGLAAVAERIWWLRNTSRGNALRVQWGSIAGLLQLIRNDPEQAVNYLDGRALSIPAVRQALQSKRDPILLQKVMSLHATAELSLLDLLVAIGATKIQVEAAQLERSKLGEDAERVWLLEHASDQIESSVAAAVTPEWFDSEGVLQALAATPIHRFTEVKRDAIRWALGKYAGVKVLYDEDQGRDLLTRLGAIASDLEEYRLQVAARHAMEKEIYSGSAPRSVVKPFHVQEVMRLQQAGKDFEVDYDAGQEPSEGTMAADGLLWGESDGSPETLHILLASDQGPSRSEVREGKGAEKWDAVWASNTRKKAEGRPIMTGPSDFAQELVKNALIRKGDRVLSLGSGIAEDEVYFAGLGVKVLATDFSGVAMTSLESREPALVASGNLKTQMLDLKKPFNVEPGSFDVVYAHQSLMYFNDAEMRQILAEASKALKPGGRIFVSVRSTEDWKFLQHERGPGNTATDDFGITRRFFSQTDLQNLFEESFKDVLVVKTAMNRYVNEPTGTILNVSATRIFPRTFQIFDPETDEIRFEALHLPSGKFLDNHKIGKSTMLRSDGSVEEVPSYEVEKAGLKSPVKQFWNEFAKRVRTDPKGLTLISSQDLYHNDWFVAFDGKTGRLLHMRDEPFASRTYSMFVQWNNGKVSSEDLGFVQVPGKAEGRVEVYNAKDKKREKPLSGQIQFAVFGQRLIHHGAVVPVENFAAQFSDVFQLYRYPEFKGKEDGGLKFGDPFVKLFRGDVEHPMKPRDRKLLWQTLKNDGYVQIDLIPIVAELNAAGLLKNQDLSGQSFIQQIKQTALNRHGYQEVLATKTKESLAEGEYYVKGSKLYIRLRPFPYPHDLIGITDNNNVVAIVLPGDKTKDHGYAIPRTKQTRVPQLQQVIIDEMAARGDPIREVFLLANSKDGFLWQDGKIVPELSSAKNYPSGSAAFIFVKDGKSAARSDVRSAALGVSEAAEGEKYLDLVDESDAVTGRKVLRKQAHKSEGLRHRAAIMWVFNRKGEVLIQRRGLTKDTFPGVLAPGAAGHVDAGEEYLPTIEREAPEEIGLTLNPGKIRPIGPAGMPGSDKKMYLFKIQVGEPQETERLLELIHAQLVTEGILPQKYSPRDILWRVDDGKDGTATVNYYRVFPPVNEKLDAGYARVRELLERYFTLLELENPLIYDLDNRTHFGYTLDAEEEALVAARMESVKAEAAKNEDAEVAELKFANFSEVMRDYNERPELYTDDFLQLGEPDYLQDAHRLMLTEQLQTLAADEASGLKKEQIPEILKAVADGSLKLKGEDIDILKIVDGKEVVVGAVDRNIAHGYELIHRGSDAFVVTPEGKFVFQRRAHNRGQSKRISIVGGHVKSGHSYREAIKEEIVEELGLPEGWRADDKRVELIRTEGAFAAPGTDRTNRERRSSYIYFANEEEVKKIREMQSTLDQKLKSLGEKGYEAWLEAEQKKNDGYGEVWSIHEFTYTQLMKVDRNELTSDLLDLLLYEPENQDVRKALRSALRSQGRSEVRDVEDAKMFDLSDPAVKTLFVNEMNWFEDRSQPWAPQEAVLEHRYLGHEILPVNYTVFPDGKERHYYALARLYFLEQIREKRYDAPTFDNLHVLASIFYQLEHGLKEELPANPEERLHALFRMHGIKNVLEIGTAGNFEFAKMMRDLVKNDGGTVSVIDLNKSVLAGREIGLEAVAGDARELPKHFPGKRFDLILSSGVFSWGGIGDMKPLRTEDFFDKADELLRESINSLSDNPNAAFIANGMRSHLMLEIKSVTEMAEVLLWDNTLSRHTRYDHGLEFRYPLGDRRMNALRTVGASAIILQRSQDDSLKLVDEIGSDLAVFYKKSVDGGRGISTHDLQRMEGLLAKLSKMPVSENYLKAYQKLEKLIPLSGPIFSWSNTRWNDMVQVGLGTLIESNIKNTLNSIRERLSNAGLKPVDARSEVRPTTPAGEAPRAPAVSLEEVQERRIAKESDPNHRNSWLGVNAFPSIDKVRTKPENYIKPAGSKVRWDEASQKYLLAPYRGDSTTAWVDDSSFRAFLKDMAAELERRLASVKVDQRKYPGVKTLADKLVFLPAESYHMTVNDNVTDSDFRNQGGYQDSHLQASTESVKGVFDALAKDPSLAPLNIKAHSLGMFPAVLIFRIAITSPVDYETLLKVRHATFKSTGGGLDNDFTAHISIAYIAEEMTPAEQTAYFTILDDVQKRFSQDPRNAYAIKRIDQRGFVDMGQYNRPTQSLYLDKGALASELRSPSAMAGESKRSELRTAVDEYIGWLRSYRWDVSRDGARMLGGSFLFGRKKAVDALLEALEKPLNPEVKVEVVRSLGKRGDARAVPSLVHAAKMNGYQPDVQSAALTALGNVGGKAAIEGLKELVRHFVLVNDSFKGPEAIRVLGNASKYSSDILPELINAFGAKANDLRAAAVEVTIKVGQSAKPALIKAMEEAGEADRRITAAEVLTKLGWKPESRDQEINFLLETEQWDELVKIGRSAVPKLIETLEHRYYTHRHSAAGALGEIGDPRAVPGLIKSVMNWHHRDGRVIYLYPAIEALGKIGDPSAIPALTEWLTSPGDDGSARKLSEEALRAIASAQATNRSELRTAKQEALIQPLRELSALQLKAINTKALARKFRALMKAGVLATLSPDRKLLFYSAGPATGKGAVLGASFLAEDGEIAAPYQDLVQKFVLGHTRKFRPDDKEKDGRHYHFRDQGYWRSKYPTYEKQGYFEIRDINNEEQMLPINSFTDTGVVVEDVTNADLLKEGDVVVSYGKPVYFFSVGRRLVKQSLVTVPLWILQRVWNAGVQWLWSKTHWAAFKNAKSNRVKSNFRSELKVERAGKIKKVKFVLIAANKKGTFLPKDKVVSVSGSTVIVDREIVGLNDMLRANRFTVFEGGYEWFRWIGKNHPDALTLFLSPFEEADFMKRAKNMEWILTAQDAAGEKLFPTPLDVYLAFEAIDILVEGKQPDGFGKMSALGEFNITESVELQELVGKIVQKLRSGAYPVQEANERILLDATFIADLNKVILRLNGQPIRASDQMLALALANEFQHRTLSRGDAPKPYLNEQGKPTNAYERIQEGIFQIVTRMNYGKENVLPNARYADPVKRKQALARLGDKFARKLFEHALADIQRSELRTDEKRPSYRQVAWLPTAEEGFQGALDRLVVLDVKKRAEKDKLKNAALQEKFQRMTQEELNSYFQNLEETEIGFLSQELTEDELSATRQKLQETVADQVERASVVFNDALSLLRSRNDLIPLADLLENLYPQVLPYLIKGQDVSPVHHVAYVAKFMAEILVSEYTLGRISLPEVSTGMVAALFHDSGNGYTVLKKIKTSKIKDSVEPAKTILRSAAKAFRLEHVDRGLQITQQILGAKYPLDLDAIMELIRRHDNPTIAELEDQPSLDLLIGADRKDLLLSFHREADRLWMVTVDGVAWDLKGDPTVEPLKKLEGNITRHREEAALYAKVPGVKDVSKFGFKEGLLYRSEKGFEIFQREVEKTRNHYAPRSEVRTEEVLITPQVPAVDRSSLGTKIGTAMRVAANTVSPLLSSSPLYASEIAPRLFAGSAHYPKASVIPENVRGMTPEFTRFLARAASSITARSVTGQISGLPKDEEGIRGLLPLVTFARQNPNVEIDLAITGVSEKEGASLRQQLVALLGVESLPVNLKIRAFASMKAFRKIYDPLWNKGGHKPMAFVTDDVDAAARGIAGRNGRLLRVSANPKMLDLAVAMMGAAVAILDDRFVESHKAGFLPMAELGVQALLAELTANIWAEKQTAASA